MTSPPVASVQTVEGSNAFGDPGAGGVTSSGQLATSTTRSTPKSAASSTRSARTSGMTSSARRNASAAGLARIAARIAVAESSRTFFDGEMPSAEARPSRYPATTYTGRACPPLPATAAATAAREIERSADQNPVTGTSGTPAREAPWGAAGGAGPGARPGPTVGATPVDGAGSTPDVVLGAEADARSAAS